MNKRLARFAPALFVLLWSSGFIVARTIRPHAEPFSFITLRFVLSAILLALIAISARARWPRSRRGWIDGLIAGALMQGVYVGGVFWSIKNGLPPAIAALISGLQPLLTGILAMPLLGEPVSRTRWIGIAIGFAGAVLVIIPNLSGQQAVPALAVLSCLIGTIGITLGTIWQKRIGAKADLRSGAAIQFVGGLLVTTPLALAAEHGQIDRHLPVGIALAWSVVVLSVITTMLLLSLIKGGAVARVASLFYLVPPLTALLAFGMFGDSLAPIQFVGMAVAAAGVAIANRIGHPALRKD